MKSVLRSALLALLSRLPWDELLDVVRGIAERRIQSAVLDRIDVLVRQAEADPESRGTEKFAWVLSQLTDPTSPVRGAVLALPARLVQWAIQTAVVRIKA